MKHTKLFRVYSAVLALAMVLTAAFAGQTFTGAAAESDSGLQLPTEFVVEAGAPGDWDTFYKSGDLALNFSGSDISTTGSGNTILTLKPEKLGADATLKSISYDIETKSDANVCSPKIVYGQEGDLLHILEADSNLTSGMYGRKIDAAGNKTNIPNNMADSGWNYFGSPFDQIMPTRYMKVTVDFTGEEPIVTMSNADGSVSRAWEAVDNSAGTTPVVALFLTQNVNIKNVEIIETRMVDYTEVLDQFIATYGTLLNASDVTVADKAEIEAATAEFAALPAEVRNARYDIQLTLEAFARKIAALEAGEDYDLGSLTELKNWEALIGHLSYVQVQDDAIILQPVASAGEGSNIVIAARDSALAPNGEQVQKVSFSALKSNPNSDGGLKIIYDYTDAEHYSYISLWWLSMTGNEGVCAQHRTVDGSVDNVTQTQTKLNLDLSVYNTITLDYTVSNSVTITVSSGAGKSETFTKTITHAPRLILASTGKGTESVTYKDFRVIGVSEDDAVAENKAMANFRAKYNEVLCLADNMVAVNYAQTIEDALTEFATLSLYAQDMMADELARLNALKDMIAEMQAAGVQPLPERAADDYSVFEDDFENGLGKWSNYNSTAFAPELVYDDAAQNSYVKLTGSAMIGPNSFSYPEKAFVKSLTYKIKTERPVGDIWNSLKIVFGYIDADNQSYITIYRSTNDASKLSYRTGVVTNGTRVLGVPAQDVLNVDYDSNWLEVTITYTTTGTATLSISDGKEIDMFTVESKQQGRPALAGGGDDQHTLGVYIDDVRFEMEAGTWTEDIVIDDINIYYSGNTGVKGDDVVTLHGEKLYDTLARAYIVKLDDDTSAAPGYVKQMDFSSFGQTSAYIAPTDAEALWDAYAAKQEPQRLTLLQPGDNEVKFIIPEELGKGIFAVKLEGFDNLSEEDDAVILLNAPRVSFAQGDDGKTSTPGSILRISGENLALYDRRTDSNDFIDDKYQTVNEHNDNVRVLLKNKDNEYIFSGASVNVKSEQYLELQLPDDIASGDYEVFVYNGYGDGASWSMPCENTITVGKAAYESWPGKVFNVQSFGASGVNTQNATGYVLDALTAAAENGGGIVYFPKGVYNLIHSIIIPENVQIVGDGVDQSVILWSPDQWKWDDCPSYLCAFTSNVLFKDIAFYGTRTGTVFQNFGASEADRAENVYFFNVRMHFNALAGNVTGGDTTAGGTGMMTVFEMQRKAEEEAANAFAVYFSNVTNARVENFTLSKQCGRPAHLDADYLYVGNSSFWQGWQTGGGNNVIYEYCHFDYETMGYTGTKILTYGCWFDTRIDNNRELYVADGAPRSNGGYEDRIIKKVESDPTGRTYQLLNGTWGKDRLITFQVYVSSGQGMGQVRRITANEGGIFEIDEPFVIEPNDNGKVIIRTPREDNYWVNNHYYNGAATGYFGGFANVLYNGNLFERVSDIYQMARSGDVNWYYSIVNNTYVDAFQIHNYGYGNNDWTGFSFIRIFADTGANATFAVTVRNNYMDGYTYQVQSFYTDGIHGVVFDKNTFENMDYAISSYGGGAGLSGIDGMLMYKNSLYNVQDYLEDDSPKAELNKYGSNRYIEYSVAEDSGGFAIGDVNGDGQISLKDATCIKLHVSSLVILTDEQMVRADFFTDGNVSLRDSTAIRHFILTGERLAPDSASSSSDGTSEPESSSQESSSSEASSSEESSSSETSSDTSSETSSESSSDSSSGTSSDEYFEGDF